MADNASIIVSNHTTAFTEPLILTWQGETAIYAHYHITRVFIGCSHVAKHALVALPLFKYIAHALELCLVSSFRLA